MNVRMLALGGTLAFIALRAARAARAPKAVVTIGPARIIKSGPRYEVDIGTARVRVNQAPAPGGGRGGLSDPNPMQVSFTVRASGLEKLAVSDADVKAAVTNNAGVLPGIGRPVVMVRDVSGGFAVTVRYPDSSRLIGSSAAKRAIESVDPDLRGRIENVHVARSA